MVIKLCKYFLILGFSIMTFLRGEEEFGYQLVSDRTETSILTPSLAQRKTLKLRLANGLEIYLISDPEATDAGAVLTVQAGSWDDPKEYPGLAHFLEHMLFLGTEKYPIESDYDHFIRLHNGKSNAYTANDYTLYLFSITPSAFREALDRFSFFFKKPLFNPSGVDRELNAINQEFAKNFNQDNIREIHVKKALANILHPFQRFSTGNSSTLAKVKQKTLKDWYRDHYSAHLMRLIVYGPESLETLKSWVIEDFKEIPSTDKPRSYPQVPVLAEDLQQKMIYIEPLKNTRVLRLTWEIPRSLTLHPTCRPIPLVSSILGYEGEGSLFSILKAEGLIDHIACNDNRLGKEHSLFSLSLNLTETGMENIFQVIEHCFQTIKSLQQQNLQPYLFDELKKIQTIRYQYQSRENAFDFLMELGGHFVYEDFSSFPESTFIPQNFNQELTRQFLQFLTPERAHFTVLARHPSIQYDNKENWMEVPYKVVEIPKEKMAAWNDFSVNSKFHLPHQNPFIPEDFKLVNQLSSSQIEPIQSLPTPTLLADDEYAKVYYAADHYFQIPKTIWFFEIKTPAIEVHDPLKVVLADLYIRSLQDALHPYSYPAELASLSYDISRTNNGILISLSGYRDTAETLFETLLTRLKNCPPTKKSFDLFKDSLLRKYRNFNQESPLQQGLETYRNILFEQFSTHQERVKALERVNYESFLAYIDHLFDQNYIEGLLYGNMTQEQATKIWKKLESQLSNQPFPKNKRLEERVLILPTQAGPYAIDHHIDSSAHATILGIQDDVFSFKRRAAQQILAQAMNGAFYKTLRTKQQTGYLLFSRAEEFNKHLFLFFGVQSITHDPRDLLSRFELFIEEFLQEMEKHEVTAENFDAIRHSLLNKLENNPQNLNETGHLLKMLAFNYEGDFEWISKRVQGFNELKYEEFLEMAKQLLGKQNKRRLAILVRGMNSQDFRYHSISNPQNIREMSQYTSESVLK